MTVKIKKVHEKYRHLFPVGSYCELQIVANGRDLIQSPANERFYYAADLCSAFSNRCAYPDIFEKVTKK